MTELTRNVRSPLPFFLCAAFLWFGGSLSAAPDTSLPKPNVLFIAVDDLRPELGLYGVNRVKSPAIDRLSASGITFDQAYCQQAICSPSRISLLSGLRPDTTGIYGLHTRLADKMPDWQTLPGAFKAAGYETISIGKIYHHYYGKNADDPQGWSRPPMKGKGDWLGRGYLEASSFQAAVEAWMPKLPEKAQFLEFPETWQLQWVDGAEGNTTGVKQANLQAGQIDFKSYYPHANYKDRPVAVLSAQVESGEEKTVWVGAGADWWMQVEVNGETAFSTMDQGNSTTDIAGHNHVFPLHLRKGTNTLTVRVRSGSAGWRLEMISGKQLTEALSDPRNAFSKKGGLGPAWEAADVPDNAYPDGANTDLAIKLMREIKEGPFFLAVGMMKPHLPFNAPQRYWDLYDRDALEIPPSSHPEGVNLYSLTNSGELRNYVGMPKGNDPWTDEQSRTLIHGYLASVSYIDAQISRLLEALKENGLEDNTIVVLWGDHGWKLGDYGEWCKHSNFELDTRVPLIIRAPGVSKPNAHVTALTELVDLYPTLCELAGIRPPEGLEGISLVPWLRNPEHPGREAAFMQYPRENGKVMGYAVKTEDARYVRWIRVEDGERLAEEFYDHTLDPGETVNRINDPAMREKVERHRQLSPANAPARIIPRPY